MELKPPSLAQDLIRQAFAEDLPKGDVTTESLDVESYPGRAKLVAKEDLVLSGCEIFESAVRFLDSTAECRWHFKDSDFALAGQTVCSIKGNLVHLLKAERVALNFLGQLSGVATLTRCYVNETRGTKCKILDTRKTTPGWRTLQKKAVVDGGGVNHRFSLSDAVLLKENHLRIAGGISEAVARVKSHVSLPIEVECTTLEEVQLAVDCKVDRILLDNMDNDQLKEALRITPATVQTEASGNMTLERVKSVAELGIDFISVGALTHSAPCADLSLLFEW